VSPALRDRLLGVLTVVFATSYVMAARSIEDSLLADAVGAGGVPQGVGLAMAVAGLGVFATSWHRRDGSQHAPASDEESPKAAAAARTVALVILLLAYAAVLPWIGYVPAVFLLLLAVGRLAGAPIGRTLLLTAGVGAPVLWLLFDRLLQVRMPLGSLWG
jgi:putative tricarboxylic transport membrane protein